MALCIGLMSGTSLDGVDGVLASFADPPQSGFEVLAHAQRTMPEGLRAELLALNRSGPDELHRAALAANALMREYAAVVQDLLAAGRVAARGVSAIGAHGQTVRHRPSEFDGTGYTLQLVNGALLAELSRIDVVCDFRTADVCAGGQGAPLVPAFHAACFGQRDRKLAVLNLGGISNLTLLQRGTVVAGFDCGPGNMLMDAWIAGHRQLPFDAGGQWAATGAVHPTLLAVMLDEPYFVRLPPKSTGRDLFDLAWLDARLAALAQPIAAVDVMATLLELTAVSVVRDLQRHAAGTSSLLVCGGGSRNETLMSRLQTLLPAVAVSSTAAAGVPPEQVEALAFAWLAHARLQRQTAGLPAVTGARQARVLGALYPAPRD